MSASYSDTSGVLSGNILTISSDITLSTATTNPTGGVTLSTPAVGQLRGHNGTAPWTIDITSVPDSGTLTFPSSSGTVSLRTNTETYSNKTISASTNKIGAVTVSGTPAASQIVLATTASAASWAAIPSYVGTGIIFCVLNQTAGPTTGVYTSVASQFYFNGVGTIIEFGASITGSTGSTSGTARLYNVTTATSLASVSQSGNNTTNVATTTITNPTTAGMLQFQITKNSGATTTFNCGYFIIST
jgi:hypothetical protein